MLRIQEHRERIHYAVTCQHVEDGRRCTAQPYKPGARLCFFHDSREVMQLAAQRQSGRKSNQRLQVIE